MKLFLVAVIVALGVFLWRYRNPNPSIHQRRREQHDPPIDEMVICPHCALHVPRPEAVKGVRGSYCSTEHRRLAES